MSTLIEQAHSREWFYSYDLPDGSTTPTYHGSRYPGDPRHALAHAGILPG